VKGFIEYRADQRILNLWGSHYDMGYAHGYLLAPEIVEMIEKYVIEERYGNDAATYNADLTWVGDHYLFDPSTYGAELQGLLDGVLDRGTDPYLDVLGRNVDLPDLKTLNSIGAYGDQDEGDIRIQGPIEDLPSTPGYVGTWTVAGQQFEASGL